MKIVALLGVILFAVRPAAAQTSLGWPETIELLAQQRTQAETCVETLKSSSDKAAVATGRLTYGAAKAQADGVIAGLTVALVEGGNPDALPTALTSLRKAGEGLQEVCNAALTAASAAGSRGLVEDILKAPIEPVVNAIRRASARCGRVMSRRTSSNWKQSKDSLRLRNGRIFERH